MLFVFTSRSRHTRCLSDWSSDVCSSDLHYEPGCTPISALPVRVARPWLRLIEESERQPVREQFPHVGGERAMPRSEERRVGTESATVSSELDQTKDTTRDGQKPSYRLKA